MELELSLEGDIETDEVIALYKANGWSSAENPEKLIPALNNSDALVTARISGKLVGMGNGRKDVRLSSTVMNQSWQETRFITHFSHSLTIRIGQLIIN